MTAQINDTHNRFIVTVWHGERRTLFYVVNMQTAEENQPDIVATFHSREQAEEHAYKLNWEIPA